MTIVKNMPYEQPILIEKKFITEFLDIEKAVIYQRFHDITWSCKAQGIQDDEDGVMLFGNKLYIKAPYNILEEIFQFISRGKIISSMKYFVRHKYLLREQPFKEKGDSSYWYATNYEEAIKSQKIIVFER